MTVYIEINMNPSKILIFSYLICKYLKNRRKNNFGTVNVIIIDITLNYMKKSRIIHEN